MKMYEKLKMENEHIRKHKIYEKLKMKNENIKEKHKNVRKYMKTLI